MMNPVLEELQNEITLQQITATSASEIERACENACATCKHAMVAAYPQQSDDDTLHVDVLIYCDKRCSDVYDTVPEHKMHRIIGSCSGATYNDEDDE